MIKPVGSCSVEAFWPSWTRTLDDMIRSLARARSRRQKCRTLLQVDLDTLRCRIGGLASLVNRSDACAVVGCGDTIYYLGAPATGAAYQGAGERRPENVR